MIEQPMLTYYLEFCVLCILYIVTLFYKQIQEATDDALAFSRATFLVFLKQRQKLWDKECIVLSS
jgi:hypothetical protein